jgi:hypothetical protein
VLDMRLIAFTTLILLTAAMPANCAEEPTVWFGLITENGRAVQARYELTPGAGTLQRIVYAPYGRTPVAFEHVVHDGDTLTFEWPHAAHRYACRLQRAAATAFTGTCTATGAPTLDITLREFTAADAALQGQGRGPTTSDVAIIDRARLLMANGRAWNRQDRRVCDDSTYPYRWSVFCALHQASIDVDGEYRHLRPAMQVVREAIQRRTAGRTFAHTLRDFNNEAPTFAAIDQVLDDARRSLAAVVP